MGETTRSELYETQEGKILEKESAFIEFLIQRGFLPDTAISNERQRNLQQAKQKAAYHNTMVLMQNYRDIIWQAECEADTVAAGLNSPLKDLDALLSRVDAEIGMGNRRLEARLEALARFRAMIYRIDDALSILKKKPGNGELLYELIYLTYIAPEKKCQNDVLYELNLSRRHFYRLREQALTVLSLRLWAAPTPELDTWMNLLTLFEES